MTSVTGGGPAARRGDVILASEQAAGPTTVPAWSRTVDRDPVAIGRREALPCMQVRQPNCAAPWRVPSCPGPREAGIDPGLPGDRVVARTVPSSAGVRGSRRVEGIATVLNGRVDHRH